MPPTEGAMRACTNSAGIDKRNRLRARSTSTPFVPDDHRGQARTLPCSKRQKLRRDFLEKRLQSLQYQRLYSCE